MTGICSLYTAGYVLLCQLPAVQAIRKIQEQLKLDTGCQLGTSLLAARS